VRSLIVVTLVTLAVGIAAAQVVEPQPPPPDKITLAVGTTIEHDVGWVRGGWFCDDQSLVTGDLVTRKIGDRETNVWIVTGVKAGATQCRVGHDRYRISLLFDVVVTAAPARPKAK
jgi:hypothetical protein